MAFNYNHIKYIINYFRNKDGWEEGQLLDFQNSNLGNFANNSIGFDIVQKYSISNYSAQTEILEKYLCDPNFEISKKIIFIDDLMKYARNYYIYNDKKNWPYKNISQKNYYKNVIKIISIYR